MNILADAALPALADAFPPPFKLTLYSHPSELSQLLAHQDILLCRSTLQVNETLLTGHRLRYVATASSGIDHIDHAYLNAHAIKCIDAKGSNAHAVADYVIATLAFLQIYKGFKGKKAGVIGVGNVGEQVVVRLKAANLEVVCYDPPKSEHDPYFLSCSQKTLTECDLLCIHAHLHHDTPHPSFNLFDEQLLSQLKPGCVLINASRGGIVNEEALLKCKQLIYCTDVYLNEPCINPQIIAYATVCTPHIAGHSLEAKYTAIEQLSKKLHNAACLSPPAQKTATPHLPPTTHFNLHWQEHILSLFNPIEETNALKKARDLTATFLSLRQLHQNRHDFRSYKAYGLNEQTKNIMGIVHSIKETNKRYIPQY